MGLDLTAYLEYPLNRPSEERTLAEVDIDHGRNSRVYAMMGAPRDIPEGARLLGVRGLPLDFHNPLHDDDPCGPPYPQWDEREDCVSWLTAQDMREVLELARSLDLGTFEAQRIVDAIDAVEAQGMACRVFCDWSY